MAISSCFNRTGSDIQEHGPGTIIYKVYGLNDDVVETKYLNLNTITDCSYLFYNKTDISFIPSGVTFDKVTAGESAFYASKISDLGNVTFKNLKTGGRMFYGCGNLEVLPESATFDSL